MPKIIADLRETLLHTAREILLGEGYGALTMREIAARCGIAVGTLYNYFPSKETLAAHVMLEDWQHALADMTQGAQRAGSALEAMRHVFDGIVGFWRIYAPSWQEYTDAGSASAPRISYHHVLIEQLAQIIAPALERFGCLYAPALPSFLAEALLTAAANGDTYFGDIAPILMRILKP